MGFPVPRQRGMAAAIIRSRLLSGASKVKRACALQGCMGPELRGTDFQLVEATLAGDAKAYRTLVERHERRIYRFLLKHVVRADEAEDLAQETFLQAYRSLRSYHGDGQFTTWLIGIGLNVARNHHNRSRQPAAAAHGDDELENLLARTADPADDVARTVKSRLARAKLADALKDR